MLRDVLIQKGLSSREAEVAELVTKGLSNKEVANQLFVTEKTVKFHLTNIYKKMNVKSRAQLIVWCLPHLGFVEKEERQTNQQIMATAANQPAAPTIPIGNANNISPGVVIPGLARGGGNSENGSDISGFGGV
ncbi:MAG: helix-turn-helix transcriptional regulator [Bdellovibrionales bacterium]|nr:helix-turn-helix transcriptional regulator [Bdellovibrionales bacterium]